MSKARFVSALHEKKKIRLTFYSKEDADVVVRTCAPMDYGPSRRCSPMRRRRFLASVRNPRNNRRLLTMVTVLPCLVDTNLVFFRL